MSKEWNNENHIKFTVASVPSLYIPENGPKIFLAGSMDNDNEENWRKETIDYINKSWFEDRTNTESITIYNPKRNEGWSVDLENEQATWNISMLNIADYIILYLTGDSVSPVSLLELGLHARDKKLFLAINDDYLRKNIAKFYYSCYGYNRIYSSIQEMVDVIKNNWNKGDS